MGEINTNCLAGMRCPFCGSLGPFTIESLISIIVNDDGVEEYGDAYWDGQSAIYCGKCDTQGTVNQFEEERVAA